MIKSIFIFLIKIYQNTLSLVLPSSCRFSPSCSQYMADAILKHGLGGGIFRGIKRVFKCHPFSKHSGWDPA